MMGPNDCCKNCAMWKENPHRGMISISEELVTGDCHRYPPHTDGHISTFPTTKVDDWCGEFRNRKQNVGSNHGKTPSTKESKKIENKETENDEGRTAVKGE